MAEELRAVIYARVSKDSGEQDPAVQIRTLRAWCTDRGWRVVAAHSDRVSGDPARRRGDPPGLRAALGLIEARQADVIAVFATDRLVRSAVGLLALVARVNNSGGHVASLQDGADLDTTTDAGELLVFVRGWFARLELRLNRARTLAGLNAARAAGTRLGRPETPLPDLAEVERLSAGGRGVRTIARKMGCSEHAARRALAAIGRGAAPKRAAPASKPTEPESVDGGV